MKILLTAFEPFDSETINPALEAVKLVAEKYPNVRGGFMHVPYAPCQVLDRPSTPSMSISDIATGIEAAIKVML